MGEEIPQAAPDYDVRPRPFRKLIAAAALAVVGFFVWQKARVRLFLHNPPQKPYVVLYGRAEDTNCEALRRGLKGKNIPFTDMPLDNPDIQTMLGPRLITAGLDPRSVAAPLVDVNGQLLPNPSLDDVAGRYAGAAP